MGWELVRSSSGARWDGRKKKVLSRVLGSVLGSLWALGEGRVAGDEGREAVAVARSCGIGEGGHQTILVGEGVDWTEVQCREIHLPICRMG